MTPERQLEIKDEATRRLSKLFKSKTFNEITVCGSFICFDMALNLYPKFVDEDEFWSQEYSGILHRLYNVASMNLNTAKKRLSNAVKAKDASQIKRVLEFAAEYYLLIFPHDNQVQKAERWKKFIDSNIHLLEHQ